LAFLLGRQLLVKNVLAEAGAISIVVLNPGANADGKNMVEHFYETKTLGKLRWGGQRRMKESLSALVGVHLEAESSAIAGRHNAHVPPML